MIKCKEEVHINAITDVYVNDVNYIARNDYTPNWKNKNCAPNFPRPPYPSNQGSQKIYNGTSNINRLPLEETLTTFTTAQTEQNKIFTDILKSHTIFLGQMIEYIFGLQTDVQALQERTRNMEVHIAKKIECQIVILAKLAGKSEPNPVESLKMMRSNEDMTEGLNKSHVAD